MNRSHRLLRAVHKYRKHRFPFAQNRVAYAPFEEVKPLVRLLRDLYGDGYFDREVALPGTHALVDLLVAQLEAERGPDAAVDQVGRIIAKAVFAGRLHSDGRYRLGGSYRPVADGCGLLAETAILDRVIRAVGEVMRRRALVDHRDDPCWPEAYLRRRAEAEDARLSLSGDEDARGASSGRGGAPTQSATPTRSTGRGGIPGPAGIGVPPAAGDETPGDAKPDVGVPGDVAPGEAEPDDWDPDLNGSDDGDDPGDKSAGVDVVEAV